MNHPGIGIRRRIRKNVLSGRRPFHRPSRRGLIAPGRRRGLDILGAEFSRDPADVLGIGKKDNGLTERGLPGPDSLSKNR